LQCPGNAHRMACVLSWHCQPHIRLIGATERSIKIVPE
jgi:hypothetical protein